MKKKRVIGLVVLLLIQLAFPIYFIRSKEAIHENGQSFSFAIQPVDPYDFFQGKYVRLNAKPLLYKDQNEDKWEENEMVYVTFRQTKVGAKIEHVSKRKSRFSLKLKIQAIDPSGHLYFSLPFHRFYTEEKKAVRIESTLSMNNPDSLPAYVVARIYNGDFVLIDIQKNGKTLLEK